MLTLSIDCAGNGCGVCVLRDGSVLAEAEERMERGQDRRLMPLIIKVMQQASLSFDALDRIAVTRGPGSFTGLRIGLAAARGIGLAADKPVIGIDRFSIYHTLFASSGQPHLVVINSRRRELFCRFYTASGDAEEATMMTPDEIAAFLADKPETLMIGDGVPGFAKFMPLAEAEHIICAKLAANVAASNPAYLPRPLYLRAPDVTVPKEKKAHDVLRVLTRDQAPLLAALHAESFGKAAWSLQQIQSSLALDTTRAWGVFDGDKIIGFILCQLIPHQSEVLAFCVHPSHRRLGAGERLLRTAADAARKAASNLYLEVAMDNAAALALYEKIGFKRTGHRPQYYRIGKVSVDAVLLTLSANGADLPPG